MRVVFFSYQQGDIVVQIYVDASTNERSNINGIGIIVIHHNIIVERKGVLLDGMTSMEAEMKAIDIGVKTYSKYMADAIYCDNRDAVKMSSEIHRDINIKLIPRNENRYADGIARMEMLGVPWKDEYNYNLLCHFTSIPIEWIVANQIVHVHNKKFYCTCSNASLLLKHRIPCRHIIAVWRKIGFIVNNKEGVFL